MKDKENVSKVDKNIIQNKGLVKCEKTIWVATNKNSVYGAK